eukprot:1860615-Pyramimonas_sp.AAC.1
MAPRRPQKAPGGLRRARQAPPDGHNEPKMAQDGHSTTQRAPQMAPGGPKTPPERQQSRVFPRIKVQFSHIRLLVMSETAEEARD